MDLFGKHEDNPKATKPPIVGHAPENNQESEVENEQIKKSPPKADQPMAEINQETLPTSQPVTIQPETQTLDLGGALAKRQRRIKQMLIVAGIVVVVLCVIVGSYYLIPVLFLSKEEPTITESLNPLINQPINELPNQPIISQPAIPQSPIILPDTPLAPLRGSLVKFAGQSVIYLVENNGELRVVDVANVLFDNGDTMSAIDPGIIYQLGNQYQSIRKGSQVVTGQVDFDPRILTTQELQPFK
ncbi:hypothetical protein IT409_00515 [Candidatus Falkowbacteria bacterium]|nr:hypothetical protein [Candidatus Falkowbacteria bacterium]